MNLLYITSLLIQYLGYFFFAYLIISLLIFVLVSISLYKHLIHLRYRSLSHEKINFKKLSTPKVSIIIPAHNEELGIIDTVNAALSSEYPNFEVIVVDDASTDKTIEHLNTHYLLERVEKNLTRSVNRPKIFQIYNSKREHRLIVVRKEHSGKADSLNAAIALSSGEYICCIDADSIIIPDAIGKLLFKFIDEPQLIALGGAIAPSNEVVIKQGKIVRRRSPASPQVLIQIIEYLRSFTTWRTGWSYLNGLLIIGGALTIFKKEAFLKVGGYRKEAICEDLEIILALHEYHLERDIPYKIWQMPDVVCWTRVPKDTASLKKQRIRWMWGALQSMDWHKELIFNKKNIFIGWISLPYTVFIDLFGPIIELLGLITLGLSVSLNLLSFSSFLVYFLLLFAVSGFYSWFAIAINENYLSSFDSLRQILRIGALGLLEPLGYRQRDAYWRMLAWWYWIKGTRITW